MYYLTLNVAVNETYRDSYMYRHIRLDTNEVFYIGIGRKEHRKQNENYRRAYRYKDRNRHWLAIVNKTDIRVDILCDNLTPSEAIEKEKEFILLYGRRDLKTGTLVNLTDGGEGVLNKILTPEEKMRRVEIFKKSVNTPEARAKSKKNHKRIKTQLGKTGLNHVATKKIINTRTGEILSSLEVSKILNIKRANLLCKMNGICTNNTEYCYYDDYLKGNYIVNQKLNLNGKPVIDTISGNVYPSITQAAVGFNMSTEMLRLKLEGKYENNTPLIYFNKND